MSARDGDQSFRPLSSTHVQPEHCACDLLQTNDSVPVSLTEFETMIVVFFLLCCDAEFMDIDSEVSLRYRRYARTHTAARRHGCCHRHPDQL